MPGKTKKNLSKTDNAIISDGNTSKIKKEHVSKSVVKENNVTLVGFCAICWKSATYYCLECQLIGYCCLSHMAKHWTTHQALCTVVNNKICKNSDYLYNIKINTPDEWRFARVKTLSKIKSELGRELEPYERDIILFPKYCNKCYETDVKKLNICKKCCQVWHCKTDPDHLRKTHFEWCEKLQLFSKLVRKQAEGQLYMFDMNFDETNLNNFQLKNNDNIESIIKNVLNSTSNDLDICDIAMISQAVTGPLTILYALKQCNYKIKKSLVVHLIGAELHFEGKTLQAWEHFFIHFLPDLINLKIIMVGPELNAENINENIRLCEKCRKKNKTVQFEYKDKLLYHQYTSGKNFTKPNIVCAFNPGFHRTTGFNQADTWPQTIKSAVKNNCPVVFTAYTAYEAPLDLQRVQECAMVHVIHKPSQNPFASLKPDRNFISDQDAPLIFKNYFISIVTAVV